LLLRRSGGAGVSLSSAIDGVPITIKDNIAMKGFPTPVGTAAGDNDAERFRRTADGARAGGGLCDVGQDYDAGLRHAGVWRL